MAEKNKWGPLETNAFTGEVFLRLRKHKDLILTPPRPEDIQNLFETLNDPRVYNWLAGTPKPYLRGTPNLHSGEDKFFSVMTTKHAQKMQRVPGQGRNNAPMLL